eukprot:CAMPEP_0170738874 /NCGR_PEP_ID=MMETSP0437-20130122/4872_1 /TAXON_ID=0 /ORGANISM="Sexangularia sp." /LENGTH=135 /DNA_ID=CAMNT_0011077315 /DNA_START=81 /DNA_END=488 /DNA_ORIENTATION=+
MASPSLAQSYRSFIRQALLLRKVTPSPALYNAIVQGAKERIRSTQPPPSPSQPHETLTPFLEAESTAISSLLKNETAVITEAVKERPGWVFPKIVANARALLGDESQERIRGGKWGWGDWIFGSSRDREQQQRAK